MNQKSEAGKCALNRSRIRPIFLYQGENGKALSEKVEMERIQAAARAPAPYFNSLYGKVDQSGNP